MTTSTGASFDGYNVAYKVKDISKSIDFYTNVMNMRVVSKDIDNAILSYNTQNKQSISITLHHDSSPDTVNKRRRKDDDDEEELGYKGISINISKLDAIDVYNSIDKYGGTVVANIADHAYGASIIPDEDDLKQFPVRYGTINDPDGFAIELVEISSKTNSIGTATSRSSSGDGDAIIEKIIKKVRINVIELEETVSFYEDILNMQLLRRRSNVNSKPKDASMISYIGTDSEETDSIIELIYSFSTDKLDIDSRFMSITINATSDALNAIKDNIIKYKFSSDRVISSTDTSITLLDPNNYTVIITQT